MPGLIKPQLPATGECNVRKDAPGRFLNFRTVNAFRIQGRHHSFEVVTHQVEFVLIVLIPGMTGHFSGWKCKDEPAMPCIDMRKAEDVFEKSAISFGIFAVNDYMGAINHRCWRPSDTEIYWESRVIFSALSTARQL